MSVLSLTIAVEFGDKRNITVSKYFNTKLYDTISELIGLSRNLLSKENVDEWVASPALYKYVIPLESFDIHKKCYD